MTTARVTSTYRVDAGQHVTIAIGDGPSYPGATMPPFPVTVYAGHGLGVSLTVHQLDVLLKDATEKLAAFKQAWGLPELETPQWQHDCSTCEFLGNYEGHDLYVHGDPFSITGTVAARWGNPGHECYSGTFFGGVGAVRPLTEAIRRYKATRGEKWTPPPPLGSPESKYVEVTGPCANYSLISGGKVYAKRRRP
jgi:hypothetical protein